MVRQLAQIFSSLPEHSVTFRKYHANQSTPLAFLIQPTYFCTSKALTESSALSYAVASEAEDLANAARGTDKKDAWALHALVHVLDQGGRASEGQSLLRRERDFWEALPHLGAAVHFGAVR